MTRSLHVVLYIINYTRLCNYYTSCRSPCMYGYFAHNVTASVAEEWLSVEANTDGGRREEFLQRQSASCSPTSST